MKLAKLLIILVGLLAVFVGTTAAQSPKQPGIKLPEGVIERQANFRLNADSIASFTYYEVRDTTGLRNFAQKAKQNNFPIIVLKKPVFDPFFDLVLNLEAELDASLQLQRHYMTLDNIHQQKIAQLNSLDSIQNKRIENYRNLSEDLRTGNADLSQQLNAALTTAKNCEKKRIKGKLWIGILGGAVGFSVASLIALIK